MGVGGELGRDGAIREGPTRGSCAHPIAPARAPRQEPAARAGRREPPSAAQGRKGARGGEGETARKLRRLTSDHAAARYFSSPLGWYPVQDALNRCHHKTKRPGPTRPRQPAHRATSPPHPPFAHPPLTPNAEEITQSLSKSGQGETTHPMTAHRPADSHSYTSGWRPS